MTDARAVERDLAAYYDQEEERASRPLDPARLAAREQFIATLAPATTVLEVGTGAGRDAEGFLAAGLDFVGVDLSREHARRTASTGAVVAAGSVRALPFPRGAFGALWSMSTLMHVPNSAIEDALREVGRVLAPGGRAAIGVWGGSDLEHHSDRDTYDPPRFFSRRSDERWRELLTIVGTVERFEAWDPLGNGFWYQYAVVRAG